jgi:hypothetical protein
MPILPPTSTYSGGGSDNNLYLRAGQPVVLPSGSTLTSAVNLKAADGSSTATLNVQGLADPVYQGAINLRPGINASSAASGQGLTVRTIAGGVAGSAATNVEIGTDGQGPNYLYIAGLSGVGQVYDEVYNQPVTLQPITKVQTDPLLTPANPEEILRCGQPAIAAAGLAPDPPISNFFTVPRTGAYTIQTEVAVGNQGVGNTVVIPSTVVGGVPIWESIGLSFRVQGGASLPYASFEVIGGEFYGEQAFASNSFITKTYTSIALLTAGVTYVVTLTAGANWNIGTAGQIKTELISMC